MKALLLLLLLLSAQRSEAARMTFDPSEDHTRLTTQVYQKLDAPLARDHRTIYVIVTASSLEGIPPHVVMTSSGDPATEDELLAALELAEITGDWTVTQTDRAKHAESGRQMADRIATEAGDAEAYGEANAFSALALVQASKGYLAALANPTIEAAPNAHHWIRHRSGALGRKAPAGTLLTTVLIKWQRQDKIGFGAAAWVTGPAGRTDAVDALTYTQTWDAPLRPGSNDFVRHPRFKGASYYLDSYAAALAHSVVHQLADL
jgi:hypothetical protein